MVPVIIGLVTCAISGAVGYLFGNSAKEARFKVLQEQLAKQAKLIAAQEIIIDKLLKEVQAIRTNRTIFQKFMWHVFKSDPALFKKFSEIEAQEKEKQAIMDEFSGSIKAIKEEFPEHPLAKVLF